MGYYAAIKLMSLEKLNDAGKKTNANLHILLAPRYIIIMIINTDDNNNKQKKKKDQKKIYKRVTSERRGLWVIFIWFFIIFGGF
jgi:nitrate/nitrite transporter NarK